MERITKPEVLKELNGRCVPDYYSLFGDLLDRKQILQWVQLFQVYLDVFEVDRSMVNALVRREKKMIAQEAKREEKLKKIEWNHMPNLSSQQYSNEGYVENDYKEDKEHDSIEEDEEETEKECSREDRIEDEVQTYQVEQEESKELDEYPASLEAAFKGALDLTFKQHADVFFLMAVMLQTIQANLLPGKKIRFVDLTGINGMALFATILLSENIKSAASVEHTKCGLDKGTELYTAFAAIYPEISERVEVKFISGNLLTVTQPRANFILCAPFYMRFSIPEWMLCEKLQNLFLQQVESCFVLMLTSSRIRLCPRYFNLVSHSVRCFNGGDQVHAQLYHILPENERLKPPCSS